MNEQSEQVRPRGAASTRRRVLFVSEAVTLAQIVRLVVLARALDPGRYEVWFASASFPDFVFEGSPFRRLPLLSLSPESVADAVRRGRRIYDRDTLRRYVASDREAIEHCRPDLVVGDLRWSLAVSAPLTGVPYAALANAYWSPRASDAAIPLPDHPMVRALGATVAGACFPLAMPFVFRHFAAPLNQLRREHGLPEVGGLRDVVTYGDHTLYADTPGLAPLREPRPTERYLGAVLWAPEGALPPGWGEDPSRVPVYVTLGSSGDVGALPTVLSGLRGLPLDVLVATAGRAAGDASEGVRFVDFVPGDLAARRARLVISNGGSTTGYQALAEGTPVIGLPHNLDQYLAMSQIERLGAGSLLRSGDVTVAGVRAAAIAALQSASMKTSAQALGEDIRAHDAAARFRSFVDEITTAEAHRNAI